MKRLIAIATAVVAAIAVAACAPREAPPEPVRAVRTLTVAPQSAGGVQEYAAEVRARTESRLGFRVGGKMVERRAEVGRRVSRGEVLARLDAGDLRLGQQAAQAAVQAAQISVDQLTTDLKRFTELREQGFISAIELERRQAALASAKAQLDQAKAQSDVQGNQAAYAALTATASGVITAVDAEVGAVLAPGVPVVRLAHDGPRDVVFSVPEDSVASVRTLLGRAAAVRVRPWGAALAVPATVREVAASADPATRTFQVKADLGAAEVQLGQTAAVLIEMPRREAVTKLPLSAVMKQQEQTAVWIVDKPTMTVKAQPITLGGADGNDVVVTSGLQPGQEVVTAGVHTLTPGQKVRLFRPAEVGLPVGDSSPGSAR